MKTTLLRLAFIVSIVNASAVAAFSSPSSKPAEARNVIYRASLEKPVLDGSLMKSFSNKYRIIAIKPGRDFVQARVKGNDIYLPDSTDPRPMREMNSVAKASVGFVVTADGRVTDLRVMESTDKRVADLLVSQVQMRHFAPARYHGAAVASLEHRMVRFGPTDEQDNSRMFKDGMGIMGQRDR